MDPTSPASADAPAALAQSTIPGDDPHALFDAWMAEARAAEPNDSNAMALATATPQGLPSVRMVLLKGHERAAGTDGPGGFLFYTNGRSRKGAEIAANPEAALLFHWKSLRRQVRIEGPLAEVDALTADAYFASRARDSQLGALAAQQSEPLDSRATFIAAYESVRDRLDGQPVPRPEHWKGYRVVPRAMEFWCDRAHRLHDRRRFTFVPGAGWSSTLLYP